MSPAVKIVSSENLVTNQGHRKDFGAKVDSLEECLHVIEKGLKNMKNAGEESVGPFEDRLPSIGESARTPNKPVDSETLQLIFKLFLGTSDRSVALEAIGKVKEMIATDRIHNLYVTVPASAVATIGLREKTENEIELDDIDDERIKNAKVLEPVVLPEELQQGASELADLWNELSTDSLNVESLGLCDVQTDVFKWIYQNVENKPQNAQVNLQSCCVVPPVLEAFTKAKKIKLLTHSDSPDILGKDFCQRVAEITTADNKKWRPKWIVRFQVFKEQRGLLEDRRYVVALEEIPQ